MKQIFGYTQPESAAPDEYVKYIMAFAKDDGSVEFHIRNERGESNVMVVPREDAGELAVALRG